MTVSPIFRASMVLSFCLVLSTAALAAPWNFTTMAPTEGPWGTRVRLQGYGFVAGVQVFYDGQLIRPVSVTPTLILVEVPENARSGWFEITQAGRQLRAPQLFQVKNDPVVTALEPQSGPSGLWVTVTGRHLTQDVRFWIGKTPVRRQFVSSTTVKVLIHAGLASGPLYFAYDQQRQTTKLRFDIAQHPVISGFTPSRGFVGDRITLTGRYFCPQAKVYFGGAEIKVVKRVMDHSLQVTLPAGVTTGRFEVECFGRRVGHGDELLIEPPYAKVQGISPAAGEGGRWIKVIGVGFTKADQFKLGSKPLRSRFLSATQVEVFIPAGAPPDPIYHESYGRWFKSEYAYTIYQPPVITGFAPQVAWQGQYVTLTGRHFCPMVKVRLAGRELPVVSREASTNLTVQIPKGVPGGAFTVQCLTWTATSAGRLRLEAPKAGVSNVSPSSAPPGARIVITGFNLRPEDRFYLGNLQLPMAFESPQRVSVVLPAGAKEDLLVHESFGRRVQTRFRILVGWPEPLLKSFEPPMAWYGEVVTLRGEQICEAPIVRLGKAMIPVVNATPETIQVTVPKGSRGGRFQVQCHNHTVVVPGQLRIEAPFAQITSIFPQRGPWGTWITLTGKNFQEGDRYWLGKTALTEVRRVSAVEVRVKVPDGAATGPIAVFSRGRRTVSEHTFVLDLPVPEISSVKPPEGWFGDLVVIHGRHFCPSPTLRFGGKPVTDFLRDAETRIQARVPRGVVTGQVEVRCFGKVGRWASTFRITRPEPRIVDVNPETGPPKTWIAIGGQNLDRVEKAWLVHRKFGRVELVLKRLSKTRLQVFVPEGCKGGVLELQAFGARVTTSFSYIVPRKHW